MSEPLLVEIRDHVAHFSDGSTLAIPAFVLVDEFIIREGHPESARLMPGRYVRLAARLDDVPLGSRYGIMWRSTVSRAAARSSLEQMMTRIIHHSLTTPRIRSLAENALEALNTQEEVPL